MFQIRRKYQTPKRGEPGIEFMANSDTAELHGIHLPRPGVSGKIVRIIIPAMIGQGEYELTMPSNEARQLAHRMLAVADQLDDVAEHDLHKVVEQIDLSIQPTE